MSRRPETLSVDTRLVRSAARRVGIWIAATVSILVLGVLIAALLIVFSQISPGQLFSPSGSEMTVDIEGVDIVLGAVAIGLVAILLAGTIALFATRRAVEPLIDALRRQRHFVADASHELRTPLAILDARLQLLQRVSGPDDPHAQLINELRDDSLSLRQVVSDLLDSLDVTPIHDVTPSVLDTVVQEAASSMGAIARERGVTIVAPRTSAHIEVAIPETSLQRSVIALLDNAIKHSPPGRVEIITSWDSTTATIAVRDHGPGIRGIEPSRIFDRFARSSDAVDGGGDARHGFGIGLALVNDTVTRYAGKVSISTTSPDGTTIEMVLPRHA